MNESIKETSDSVGSQRQNRKPKKLKMAILLIGIGFLFVVGYKSILDLMFLKKPSDNILLSKDKIDVVQRTMNKKVMIKGGQIICYTRKSLDLANSTIDSNNIDQVRKILSSGFCQMVNANTPAFMLAEATHEKVFIELAGLHREMWANEKSIYEAEHSGFASSASGNASEKFMREVKLLPYVIEVYSEGMTLWVQVSGEPYTQYKGHSIANMIFDWHVRAVGRIGCVKVFHGNRGAIIGTVCSSE